MLLVVLGMLVFVMPHYCVYVDDGCKTYTAQIEFLIRVFVVLGPNPYIPVYDCSDFVV